MVSSLGEVPEHHPNLKDGSGLMCFKDKDRPCSPECMAFLTHPPEGPDYQDVQWAHCHELVYMHRAGKHLVVIAQCSVDQTRIKKNQAADAQRALQPKVPSPLGGG